MVSIAVAGALSVACQQSAGARPATVVALGTGPSADSALFTATFDSAWVRVRDTYYDPGMRGIDWIAARDELRPRAARAATVIELRAVLAELLSRLGESHFVIVSREAREAISGDSAGSDAGDVGMELRLVEDRLLVLAVAAGGPAATAGVRAGWELVRVGGKRVAELHDAVSAATAGNDRLVRLHLPRAAERALSGDPGTPVEIEIRDGGGRLRRMTLLRRAVPGIPVRLGFLPPLFTSLDRRRIERGGRCVGVIEFTVWMPLIARDFERAFAELERCPGMVIDLRGNPGGVAAMVMGIAGHFLERPDSLGVLRLRGSTLRFVTNPRYSDAVGNPARPFRGKLAIVVDDLSASTSEIFAGAMQHRRRARIFGSTTPGLALPAAIYRLPNDDLLIHALADFTLPDGTRIEGVGVIPDVPVPVTRAALLAGRDPALDSAVEWAIAPN